MSARIFTLAACAFALTGPANADAGFSVASGVDYSSGDYGGTTETEVVSIPLVMRVVSGAWELRASSAYMEITGPADVADSDGGAGGGGVSRTDTARGLGDTNLAVSYTVREIGGSNYYFEGTGRVRLPTGDAEKGLGVGETDYGLSGELGLNRRDGGGSIELTRRFLADHGSVQREDGWQANASVWIRPSESSQTGIFGYWRESSTAGGGDPAQLGGYFSYRITPNLRVNLSASGGLSDASPDFATGLRLTWRTREHD